MPAILIVSPAFNVVPVLSSPTTVILAAVFCVVESGNVNTPLVPNSQTLLVVLGVVICMLPAVVVRTL